MKNNLMQAVVYRDYGPPEVLKLEEIEKPAPKGNEVLVRVRATPVNYGDLLARNMKNVTRREFNMPLPLLLPTRLYFGVSKPKITILGSEFAGVIEAVGEGVTLFRPGDPVMGYLGQRMGAYAEYLCMPEDGLLALKPVNMSFEDAATLPYGAIIASSLLRKGNLQSGQKVLINGASGGIGAAAVQLAKAAGAEVTGVCGAPRLAFVRSLGADHVIDYTRQDFTQNGETYDLIFDILGKSSFSQVKGSLNPGGRYLLASFKTKQLGQMAWTSLNGTKKVICAFATEKAEDLVHVKDLVEAGKFKANIDVCYPLEQAAEAHRYAENGRKQGQIVLVIGSNNHKSSEAVR